LSCVPGPQRRSSGPGQRILDGEWKPGQRIPPVHAFTKTYGASERTVARAIHALALKDVLTLERGACYVAARG
jgi:DNA-binding GntR family transcriptional regulator